MLWHALLLFQLQQPTIINKPLPVKKRQRDTTKNYIVLHYDDGNSYKATRRTLIRHGNSYHYFIHRDGSIVRLLDPKYEAGHAGISYYNGMFRMNHYSIAICLQNDSKQLYSEKQYENLAWLIKEIQKRYTDSTAQVVIGHSDIAIPRGRKIDPGEHFDWNKLNELLRKYDNAINR